MLNFYVVSAGRDMVNDTDRSTTCRSKFKLLPLQRKIQKLKVLPRSWVSLNTRLNISDQELKTFTFGIREQIKGATKPQRQQLKMDLVTKKKWIKTILREAFRLKLWKLLQDSNKSSRRIIKFFLNLLAHGKFNDANAATFRPELQSPAVLPHFQGNML